MDKGQFFRPWNYPNKEHLKPARSDKVHDNKIINKFNEDEDEMIDNFAQSNNGFFTYDCDVDADVASDDLVTKKARYTKAREMRMLWKVVTYIRINNL
ncbi:hypothetical protein C6P40_000042 [Pichia californica]|uniref:Uncharacterized protein n=1 Tax=Pichia californica TaxID=460514 RepID=A0A9P6WQF6_9ASCO|nr:hypothetical protein C6P40_000042 [[Candida] californica]